MAEMIQVNKKEYTIIIVNTELSEEEIVSRVFDALQEDGNTVIMFANAHLSPEIVDQN